MATYKEIHGVHVQYRDSDATAVEGDVWYNATTGLLKMYAAVGAWASGGNLNTARMQMGGAGTQTAAIIAAGRNQASPITTTVNAETYDGSSWTEVANVATTRFAPVGGGTQTAAFIVGGRTGPSSSGLGVTETWDNSSWTEVADLNTARAFLAGNGTTTAALVGAGGPPTVAIVESWNGTSWTEVGDLNTADTYRSMFGAAATQTAAVCIGGEDPEVAISETWDGSSWTEGTNLNTARGGSGISGIATSGLVFGGTTNAGHVNEVESYDGTSYTEENDMSRDVAYNGPASHGTQSLALAAGGASPGVSDATEEWTVSASVETVAFD